MVPEAELEEVGQAEALGVDGIGELVDDPIQQQPIQGQPGIQNFFGQGMSLGLLGGLTHLQPQGRDHLAQSLLVIVLDILEDIPDGLQDPIDAEWPIALILGLLTKGFCLGVVVVIPPEVLLHLGGLFAQFFGDQAREGLD